MSPLRIAPEVRAALDAGRPVVALESTIISHGLPRPDNVRVALDVEKTVRRSGATPATVAVVAGEVCVGMSAEELEAVAGRDDVVKVGVRDVATVAARGGWGATTVASTAHCAARAGIPLFATGGLGGVHREARASWDESADLVTLGGTGITVVCAGVKSILDVPATLERLESLNVAVLGYRTSAFPGFYLSESGHRLDWRVDSPEEVAAVMRARTALGTDRHALVVANPLLPHDQLDPQLHDTTLRDGLAELAAAGVTGKEVTPYLLEHFHRVTHGASLAANIRIILGNAALAAQIAVAYAQPTAVGP
jgi:pseudouridine-5'-phosphate glycosidase